jgi:hypothetical protein
MHAQDEIGLVSSYLLLDVSLLYSLLRIGDDGFKVPNTAVEQ